MVFHCYAKINLTLEILGKRADGYHEVRTVMQTVGLADRLEVTAAAELSFSCSDPALATPDNLVYRAARLLQAEYAVRTGAALRLEKRIPVAAGLGGGSSDAAATIVALNRLWNLQQSLTEQRRLAARLGSDVPFFLTGGTALATGRGERITPLPPLPQYWVVLVLLPRVLSTAAVYQAVTPADYTSGVATADVVAAAQRGTLSPQSRLAQRPRPPRPGSSSGNHGRTECHDPGRRPTRPRLRQRPNGLHRMWRQGHRPHDLTPASRSRAAPPRSSHSFSSVGLGAKRARRTGSQRG